jgi:hypothetical protein
MCCAGSILTLNVDRKYKLFAHLVVMIFSRQLNGLRAKRVNQGVARFGNLKAHFDVNRNKAEFKRGVI